MANSAPYERLDPEQLAEIQEAERPPLRVRWWLVLPLGILLSAAQSFLNLSIEFSSNPSYLVATQISVIAFAFLFLLSLVINPFLRLTRLIQPLNRAEVMAVFAALFVSGGISSFGLADVLVPTIAAPFNPTWNTPQSGRLEHLLPNLNPHLYITDPEVIREFRMGFGNAPGFWKRIPWWTWAKPLAGWMVFILAMYAMFYSVALLFFDTWSRREKLVFPLARLPEAALSDEGAPRGTLPSLLSH